MSTRWYEILFRFEVLHDFYFNGHSADISIQPTNTTAAQLSGYRHLLRYKDGSPVVIFEAIDDQRTPLLPIDNEIRLVFTGRLINSYFSNFTDLPIREIEQVYLFDNLNGSGPLQVIPVYLRPQKFSFAFTTTRVNATLMITDRDGNTILNKAIHNSDKNFSENLDLTGRSGLHHFTVTTTQGIEVERDIYISHELYNHKPWCIIEIFQKGAVQFNCSVETIYRLEFKSLQKPWKYKLNLTRDYQNATFLIEDKENYGSPKDHPYTKINFVEASPAQTYEQGKLVSFISGTKAGNSITEQAVPYFEKPKKDLQLTISKNGSDTIIRPLPIPSSISPDQEININI